MRPLRDLGSFYHNNSNAAERSTTHDVFDFIIRVLYSYADKNRNNNNKK